MKLLLAILALQAPGVAAPDVPSRAGRVVDAAVAAVDGDSVEAVRARWRVQAMAGDELARLGLATLLRETYRYAEADRQYEQLLRNGSDASLLTHVHLGAGLGKLMRWRTDSAAHAFREALLAADLARDPTAAAQARLGLAAIAARTLRGDTTRALAERAGRDLDARAADLDVARIRCGQAAVLRASAIVRADSLVRSGVDRARAAADARTLGRCLLVLAQVLEIRGLQADSRRAVDSAVVVLRSTRDMLGRAAALQFLAYAATTYSIDIGGGYRAAQDAVSIARAAGDEVTAAWATLNLAQIAARLGDAGAAGRHALQARTVFERINDRFGLAAADMVDATAHLAARRFDEARVRLERAFARNDSIGWHTSQPWLLFEMAAAARGAGDVTAADVALDEAMTKSRALGMRGWDVNEQYARGLNALARAQPDRAIAHFEAYLAAMSSWSRHYLLEGELRLAEAHARAGNLDAAEQRLERAFLHLGYVRDLQTDREAALAALQARQLDADPDLGIATIVSIFVAAGRTETAFRIVEAQRARVLWTRVVRRRAIGTTPVPSENGSASSLIPEQLRVATLIASMPDSTALIEYITGSGGEPTTAFVITGRGLRSIRLGAADSLTDQIRRFGSALEGGAPAQALARSLGTALFDPIARELPAGTTRLFISPDGPLHRLPFDALMMRDGGLVLERYEITVTPSARLALANLQPHSPGPTRGVVLGDARFDAGFDLAPLADSRTEARAVARTMRNAQLLLGEDASEVTLRAVDWSDVGLLHLATHARVEPGGVTTSAIFVGAGGGMDGRIGVADIAALQLRADLVVLSSCRTLGGAIVTGEGLQGLTAPFLEAGARAVAATYWAVGDRSIQPLIERFYEGLGSGMTAGAALTEAKRRSLAAGDSPAVWAAFSLTGDATVRPAVF